MYAQDEDVSILATRKQWAAIGRNLIPRAKGVAVCVYRNARLTLDYLFDVSQTTGREIHPTDWQLSDDMKKALTERLSYAHGFSRQDFSQALYALAGEAVADHYHHFLQELQQVQHETQGSSVRGSREQIMAEIFTEWEPAAEPEDELER